MKEALATLSFFLYAAIILGSIFGVLCLFAAVAGFFSGIIHGIREDL